MLIIKVSSNRVFLVNEYWILVPIMLLIDIVIIVKVKKNRAKKKLEAALKARGGQDVVVNLVEDYIEVTHPNCLVGKGLRYVNNKRLRNIVHSLFKSKAKNGVIYITKTALCHLVKMYGLGFLGFPALPIPIPDFIEISNWLLLGKKIVSITCLGISLPMLILAQGYTTAILIGGFAIVMMFNLEDPGFLIISSEPVLIPVSLIRRRIADQPELVSVDLEFVSTKKIMMPEFSGSYQCLLPVQIMFNSKCSLRPSEIVDVISNANVDVPLDYYEVVNMEDITKLKLVKFSDQFEVTPNSNSKPIANDSLRGTKHFRNRAKTSKFLQKFGDTGVILDSEEWDVTTPASEDGIIIRNKEL
jgi:hypothetical protein